MILKLDEENGRGKRSIQFSKFGHVLKEHVLTEIHPFSFFSMTINFKKLDKDNFQIEVPEMNTFSKFPKHYDHISLKILVQGINDIYFNKSLNKYQIEAYTDVGVTTEVLEQQLRKNQIIPATSIEFHSSEFDTNIIYALLIVRSTFDLSKPTMYLAAITEVF